MADRTGDPVAVRIGPLNNNWRGGRIVTPAGYVLLRLPEHLGADVRGYVAEHRVVMEQVLGRSLKPGERVRHRDNDPGNNEPGNLLLIARLNRETTAACACGCGTEVTVRDSSGRTRRYVSGHNSQRRRSSSRRPKAETGAGLAAEVKHELSEIFGGLCAYGCGRLATCWDHLVPWCDGGTFRAAGNTVPACAPCNHRKAGSDPWSWIDRAMSSDQSEAMADVVSLALSWGLLNLPDQQGEAA